MTFRLGHNEAFRGLEEADTWRQGPLNLAPLYGLMCHLP